MKKAGKTGLVCDHCKGLVEVERATSERPYRYDMSGIGNIFLVGIDVEVCKKCGSRSPIIPKVAGLHKAIAEGLLDKQDLLAGEELRFLRKHAGIAASRFAALLGVDPSYLSRFENGKTETLSAAADKLARAIVLAAQRSDAVNTLLMALTDKSHQAKPATFGIKKDHWQRLAA
jgi:putative zinc finger/helix-turn-helix YgiT family protein